MLTPIADPFKGENRTAALEWLASRPPKVRALAAEFPFGTVIRDGEREFYVIGWSETDDLILSPLWPGDGNYDLAMALRERLCARHVRDGEAVATRVS